MAFSSEEILEDFIQSANQFYTRSGHEIYDPTSMSCRESEWQSQKRDRIEHRISARKWYRKMKKDPARYFLFLDTRRRYEQARPKEARKEINRRWYLNIKADPQRWAAYIAKKAASDKQRPNDANRQKQRLATNKRYYQRHKSDPAFMERIRESRRRSYRKSKDRNRGSIRSDGSSERDDFGAAPAVCDAETSIARGSGENGTGIGVGGTVR